MMSEPRPAGRVLTFYSYKGGTGRSMAMANVAWILACQGKRVLMIDWDLEAPGLHRYFLPFLIDEELSSSEGLLDMVDRYASRAVAPLEEGASPPPADWYLEYADYSDYLLSINFKKFAHGGKLDLLPAGRQGDAYAVKVNSFNWQNLYDRLGGGGFFEAVKARAVQEYDYVLIDSRTGVSDTAGICSVQMPDTLVVCFTYNNQSIKGAASVAQSAVQRRQRLVLEEAARRQASPGSAFHDSPRPYRVFAVPMRVDASESDRLALRQAFARSSFADLISHTGIANAQDYWGQVEVPYISFYAYEEVLSAFKDDPRDPKTVLSAFVRLTKFLTDGAVEQYNLPIAPAEKQALLERFAETPLTAAGRAALADSQRETDEEAIVRRSDAAMASLPSDDRVVAWRVFSRLVRVASKEEGGGVLPIRASIDDFGERERHVISRLADHQILRIVTDAAGMPSRVHAGQSVAFDDARLVRLWRPLADFYDTEREFLLWRQQLRNHQALWERSGRPTSALLAGSLLNEAHFWSEKRPDDLNAAEREYLERSAARPAEAVLRNDEVVLHPLPSPGPQSRPFYATTWFRLALMAVGLILVAWVGFKSYSTPGPRSDVILAAANATTDPLERALLLLELGPAGNDRPGAVDLALQTASRALPYAVLRGADRPATTVRFTPDGTGLVAGFDDGSVRVWRSGSFESPSLVNTQVGSVVSTALDAKAEHLLVTGRNNVAEYWSLTEPTRATSRTIVADLLEGTITDGLPVTAHRGRPSRVASKSTLFLAQFSDQQQSDPLRSLATIPESTAHLVFSGDGRWAAGASAEGLGVWELPSGRSLLKAPIGSFATLRGLLVAPTGAYVAAVTPGEVFVWPIGSSQKEPLRFAYLSERFPRTQASSSSSGSAATEVTFALSSNGEMVAIAYNDGSVRLLRANGESMSSEASPAITRAMAFSPDGVFLAASGGDGTTRIWRISTTVSLVSSDWTRLTEELRSMTTACLSKEDRVRLLGESGAQATAAAAACEQAFGLKSLAAPRATQ